MVRTRDALSRLVDRFGGFQSWSVALAVAIALFAVSPLATGLFDQAVPLTHFQDRAVGVTAVQGVDASGYAHTWVRMHALFVVVSLGSFLLANLVGKKLRLEEHPQQLRGVLMLSEIAIALMLLDLFVEDPLLARLVLLLFAAIGLIFLLAILRRFLDDELLADSDALAGLLLLPFPFLFAIKLALNRPLIFGPRTWIVYAVLLLAAYLLARRDTSRAVMAGAPLLLIPASIPLANELQYRLFSFHPRSIALVAVAALLLAGATLYRWPPRLQSTSLIRNFYFPTVLMTLALFKAHHHVRLLPTLDYFHLGERTLPTQQLFLFSKIPLMDLRLTHTLSDMVYPTLYTLLNDYRGIDMVVWGGWLHPLVAIGVVYFFLARVTVPIFSLLVTALLPILGLVPDYYAFVLVPPLFLYSALARPSFSRWLGVWISSVLLLLWRIDFGLAGLMATALVLAVCLSDDRDISWKDVFLPLAAVAGTFMVALGCLALLSHRPVFETLAVFLQSYTVRLTTRARAEIVREFDVLAVVQYYLLPAVSLIYILEFGLRRMRRGRGITPWRSMLAYVAAFSLVISTRALERHSLWEGFSPYLFLFLWACLPLALAGRKRGRPLFLGIIVLITLFVLPPLGSKGPIDAAWYWPRMSHLFQTGPLFELRRWTGSEARVRYDDRRHRPLIDFLKGQLNDDQTFFDFSNAPLLYLFADAEFPTYVIPNLEHNTESAQRHVLADLKTFHDQDRLPFVVFRQGDLAFDASDGFANEVRSYRIAEFIYAHYEPALDLNGFHLWKAKGVRLPDFMTQETSYQLSLLSDPHTHQMEQLSENPTFRATGEDPYLFGVLDLDSVPSLSEGYWRLEIEYGSSSGGHLQMFFSTDNEPFTGASSVWSRIAASEHDILEVPLVIKPTAQRLTDVRFDPPFDARFDLHRVRIVGNKQGYLPLRSDRLVQEFDLQRLPFVWGTFDPWRAAEVTEVLAVLQDADVLLDAEETITLPLPQDLDHGRAQYLHLRLRRQPKERPVLGDVHVSATYGTPPSSFRWEEVPLAGDEEGFRPAKQESAVLHNLTLEVNRGVYRLAARGPDPYAHRFLRLDGLAALDPGQSLHLRMRIRCSQAGTMQLFPSIDGQAFDEDNSVWIPITTALAEQQVLVTLPVQTGQHLDDLRFDPPDGAVLELQDVELFSTPAHDYLVRLSTQWRWSSDKVEGLTLTASSPVLVERVVLRSGD